MAAAIRPLVAGNWKMNGVKAALNEITAIAAAVAAGGAARADVAICPPATLLAAAVSVAGPVLIGAQDRIAKAEDHTEGGLQIVPKLERQIAHRVIAGHRRVRCKMIGK